MYKVKLKHRCEVCNQVLHDDESIKNRLGPICHHKVWGDLKPMDWGPPTAKDFDADAWQYTLKETEYRLEIVRPDWFLHYRCDLHFDAVCTMYGVDEDENYVTEVNDAYGFRPKHACEGCYNHLVEYEKVGRPGDDEKIFPRCLWDDD